jgi:hypothetical protein
MRYLLIIVVYLIVTNALAQEVVYPYKKDKSIVRVKEFYNGYGKIFDLKPNNNLLPTYTKSTFLVGTGDILFAEKLMSEKFTDLVKSDERLKALIGKTYKQEYSNFYRQYVGLINNEGEKMVYIHVIKCCKKSIRKCFPDWEKVLGNPLDEDPCTITNSYVVNLSQKTISAY